MSRVLGMAWVAPDRVFVGAGADNHIKMFDVTQNKIVSGGSLVHRLHGSTLTCMESDHESSRVYLGTNTNLLLVYTVSPTTYEAKHIFSLTLSPGYFAFSCLHLAQHVLYAGFSSDVVSFSVGSVPGAPVLQQVCVLLAWGIGRNVYAVEGVKEECGEGLPAGYRCLFA